ncbi:MAG: hypothetical protein EBZ61_10865 [Micrococcales bacterium]|nr:hypothetical protein [Micrococcales bacterium]
MMKKASISSLLCNIGNAETELHDTYGILERSRMPKKIVDKAFELYSETEALRVELQKRLKSK